MVFIFIDLNKSQVYKRPFRDTSHHEIEILSSFYFLKLFRTNELTEDYHIRKPNDESFLFGIEDKKNFCAEEIC